uniref:U11/U12 small nuclear ribonucleoprotein 35 kDa protein n=3 Tax=Dendroctonus ponderosae TaxID=77166 RepID=A0AAR5P6S7_DENPD
MFACCRHMESNINMEPETDTWVKYAKTYDPIKCASIDGTDSEPHDRAVLRALNSDYNPNRFVKGRPESTIFISRLNHETSKETIKDIFSKYGKLRRFRLVKDIVTGMPKGYAFVEYEEEQAAEEAYRLANRMVVDGNAIFVDFECERLLKGWKPRRLGGGFAGKKESGQLRFGGRDRPFKKPIALELKEQEERRQKELRNRADERRRRDNSRERNRRKLPLRENGVSLQKEPKKSDGAPKDQTKRRQSSKEKTDGSQGSPATQKSSSRKRRQSTEKTSDDPAKKPESSPLNKSASEKDDNKPPSSKKRPVSPKERSRHRSRDRRRNRSNERRRSPLAEFGRPRSPVERNRKRNSPKRTKRTSRSPKRPARNRSPRQNDKEPAILRDRLRSRSPSRKYEEGFLPLGSERRSRRTKQDSLERQVNHSKQNRDRLATTEPNRFSQPSPHRMNERYPQFAPSPASPPRQGSREQSPGRKQAREDYSAEKSNRRLLDNDEYAVSRSRRAISPKHEYSRPPEDPRLKHPAYQDFWQRQEQRYKPYYPEEMKNGKEFSFAECAPHLGALYPSYGSYLVSSQQFSSVGSPGGPGRISDQAIEQPNQPPGRIVYDPKYDQPPSRDPRLNITQYAAQLLPQQPVLANCNYGQIGEYYQLRRTEQVDIGSKQHQSAASAGEPFSVSREVAKHPNTEERYVRGRTRP